MSSPNINKLFSELLVSKNRLSILRSYYTGIKDSIVDNLTELYNNLEADVSWVDRKISDLAVDKSDALTTMSKFVSNTEDSLIVNHEKYQEMMTAYNSHIKDFYSRMTNLYSSYEQNFRENEISDISNSWKFYYTTNYSDAQPVEHSFGPLNFTSESDIFELSNDRFIYMTNENVVYDVDYVGKTVYIVTIDSKTFANQFNQKQGSKSNYYGNERASFNTLFRLNGKSNIYALINIGSAYAQDALTSATSTTTERALALVGPTGDTSPIQRLVPCVYDYKNHRFNVLTSNTSELFIRGSVLKNNKIHFIDGKTDDYYFYYIGPYLVRVKIDGASKTNSVQRLLGTSSIDIVDAVLDSTNRISIPISESSIAVYDATDNTIDFSGSGALKIFNFASLKAQFVSGEEGKIQALFHATDIGGNKNEAIYAVTDKSIWYTTDRFTTVSKDTRTNSISITNLAFTNKDEYLIDEFGYIYVLGDNARLYCAKTIDGITLQDTVVESPTRYADKIVNISSLIKSNLSGYLYSIDPTLTKYQETDKGGESFVYTYTQDDYDYTYDSNGILINSVFKNSTWYGITETGKIVACDIDADGTSEATKKHLWTRQSICDNKTISAITYDENTEMFYFALEKDYSIYYISKANFEAEKTTSSTIARVLGDVKVGSKINAIIKIDDVLYFGCNSGEIHCYTLSETSTGVIKGKFHTASITLDGYDENDSSLYHISDGKAIGKTPIRQMITDGSCLIVLGDNGRVASCSLNSNIWTSYKGEPTNSAEIDSIIYSDGSAVNGNDIVCGLNYLNSKLIIVAKGGYISSCNLLTGNWTTYENKTENHGQTGVGPGICNNGTILGGLNPTCCTRIGSTMFIAGENGRIGSINLVTGGVTEYRGTTPEVTSELSGPGYYYTGSDLASLNDASSLAVDGYTGSVIMCGEDSFILSYSPSANEALTPTVDKLYYIARRQSDYDYLSSLLVRVTKGTLNEYTPLYPPQEENDNFKMAYESSYYVYQDGNYVWRVSTGFDKIYFSKDRGITYKSMEIGNSSILPEISTNTVRYIPMGAVSNDGSLMFVDNIAGNSYFIYGTHSEDDFDANWCSSPYIFTQKQLNSLYCEDNGTDYRFIMDVGNGNGVSDLIYDNKAIKISGINAKALVLDEAGNEYELVGDFLYKNDAKLFDINSLMTSYLSSVLGITDSFTIPSMYYTKGNNFTFVINLTSRIILATLNFVEIDEGLVEDNYSISSKVLNLNEAKLENAKGLFTENYESDVTTFEIQEDSLYLATDFEGIKGFLGFNIRITSNNYTSTDYRHVIIALTGDVYGTTYVNDSSVYNIGDTAAKLICYDRANSEIQLAYYNTLDSNGIIKHTNSIHKYTEVEAITYTPIRALTDAWKSCEIKMSDSGINAFAIRLKMRNTEEDTEEIAIAKQFTLRYQVLICDITNGKYILYETEKSTGISKTDDETKAVEPFIRVIACDGFEDEIMELYTSRRDTTRRSIFTNKSVNSSNNFIGSFKSRIETTYDFETFVQRRAYNDVTDISEGIRYQIKIKPLNTLPSNVDAEFFIEPYKNPTVSDTSLTSRSSITNPIKDYENNIDKSEFKLAMAEVNTGMGFAFGIPGSSGFLTKSQLDIGHMTHKPYVSNVDYLPQYDERESDIAVGKADTYVNIIRGEGNGLFDKLSGIITNTGSNTWKVVPFSVNKEDIRYSFDEDGSSIINSEMDTNLLKNGRNLFKMRNFSIFSKGVTNDADFYTDYENNGRIAKVEGTMVNSKGLFEVISSMDGHQKRINPVSEIKDGSLWRTTSNAYEYIKSRIYGKSYDIIDRFSIFEDPYYAVQAWWIPAQGYITKGNERFLSLGFDETSNANGLVGRKYLPHDSIEAATVVNKNYSGNINNVVNGVVSTTSGNATYDTDKVIATKELIDEKFPLERWDGFEWADLNFIRKWEITYTDDSIEYSYEIEGPMIYNPAEPLKPTLGTIYTLNQIPIPGSSMYNIIPSNLRSPKPTIPRNLYSYWDNFDWEGRGTQVLKCATAYFYSSHNWKIYHHEVQENVYDWTDEQKKAAASKSTTKSFYNEEGTLLSSPIEIESEETMESLIEDNNYARNNIVSSTVTEDKWYIPETNNVNIASINHNNEKYYSDYPFSNTVCPDVKDDRGIPEFNNFPRSVSSVVGEMITNIYAPVVDTVYELEVKQPYKTLAHNDTEVKPGNTEFKLYRRGNILQSKEHFTWNFNDEEGTVFKRFGYMYKESIAEKNWINPISKTSSQTEKDALYLEQCITTTASFKFSRINHGALINSRVDITNESPGLIAFYSELKNELDKEDSEYIYRNNSAIGDADYGYTGCDNSIGHISYVQYGYLGLSKDTTGLKNSYFRGIDSVSDNEFTWVDSKNKITLSDKDFIVEYKSFLAHAEGDKASNFGITTKDSGPVINVVSITDEGSPLYEKYCGGKTLKYMYCKKKNVSIKLIYTYNGATDTDGKYYKDGEDVIDNSYKQVYCEHVSADAKSDDTLVWGGDIYSQEISYFTSRHSLPANTISDDATVVDKLLYGYDYPTRPEDLELLADKADCISKNYKFWSLLNNGNRVKTEESYINKYRWIRIYSYGTDDLGSTIDKDGRKLLNPTDTSGENFQKDYVVRCLECYQWVDGSVMEFNTEHTVEELIRDWGITVVKSPVSIGHNDDSYTVTISVTFTGPNITDEIYNSDLKSISITSVNEVEYAETTNTVGNANVANVISWSSDDDTTSNGVNDDSGKNVTLDLNLFKIEAVSDNQPKSNEPFVIDLKISEEDRDLYVMPSSVIITLGSSTDAMLPKNYTYVHDDVEGSITIRSGAIKFDDETENPVLHIEAKASRDPTKDKVTYDLTNITSSNTDVIIANGSAYTTTLTPDEGYYLPETISVTVNGADISNDIVYDKSSGGLVIGESLVSGDIIIKAVAAGESNVILNLTGLTCDISEKIPQYNTINTTIVPDEKHKLPSTIEVTIGGKSIDTFTYDDYTGSLTIPGSLISGDVEITGTGIIKTVGVSYSKDSENITFTNVTEVTPILEEFSTEFTWDKDKVTIDSIEISINNSSVTVEDTWIEVDEENSKETVTIPSENVIGNITIEVHGTDKVTE